jgi:hypothetical protein
MGTIGGMAARKKRVPQWGWVAAVVVTLAVTVSACQSKLATRSGDAGPAESTSVSTEPTSSGDASRPAGADSSADAVAVWVTHIMLEEYTEACWLSATVAAEETGQDAETVCASGGSGIEAATQLHEAWVKPGVALPPDAKVEVDDVDAQGDTATVPDTSIRVGDKSLREIELIGSSGDTDSFQLSLEVQRKDGLWYVAGMHISV